MKDLTKWLSIELEGKENHLLIKNLWSCYIDQVNNELIYNTADDTMNMKSIKLDNVEVIRVYQTYHLEDEPNVTHDESMFTWYKDLEATYRKIWEDE